MTTRKASRTRRRASGIADDILLLAMNAATAAVTMRAMAFMITGASCVGTAREARAATLGTMWRYPSYGRRIVAHGAPK
jgi:hypothetical protein